MRLLAPLRTGLVQPDPDKASVLAAHKRLVSDGYEFVGYHGTNHQAFMNMFDKGLDPSRIGSNSGTAKGGGFYVSHQRGYADDWAEQSTQGDDPQPPKYEVQIKAGDEGVARVVRVYARQVETMLPGIDVAWGLHPSSGDANDDKKLGEADAQQLERNATDLEMVISPRVYGRLALVPSVDADWDKANLAGKRASWPAHRD